MLLKFSHTLPLPGPAYHSPCRGGDNTPDWSTGRVCLCVCVYEVLPLLFSLWVPTPSSLFLCAYALILWSGLSHSSQSRREGEKRRRKRRRRERRRYGKEKQADYSPDASTQAEIFFPLSSAAERHPCLGAWRSSLFLFGLSPFLLSCALFLYCFSFPLPNPPPLSQSFSTLFTFPPPYLQIPLSLSLYAVSLSLLIKYSFNISPRS